MSFDTLYLTMVVVAFSAFALILALEWAEQFDPVLSNAIRRWSVEKFEQDQDCQAWEPGGDEFLSPALIEAMCMSRVLPVERGGGAREEALEDVRL